MLLGIDRAKKRRFDSFFGRQFTFNGDNKQVEVRNSANQVIGEYKYDGLGKRIKKDTATEYVVFVYDGLGKLIGEYSAEGPPDGRPQVQTITYVNGRMNTQGGIFFGPDHEPGVIRRFNGKP